MPDNPITQQKASSANRSLPSPAEEIDLLELASILLTHWWKIAICALVGALVMLVYSTVTYTPKYTATAKLYINNNKISIGISQVSINSSDLSASQALVEIYSELINTHLILDATGDSLADKGLPGYDYYNLVGRVSTRAVGNTQMLYLTVWDSDPETAISIINTLLETMPDLAENIIEGSSIHAIDPAYSANLSPSPLRKNVMMGAMVGMALSAGLVLLYYFFLNDQVQRQDWLQDTYPALPQLGCVPDTVLSEHAGYNYYNYSYGYGDNTQPASLKKRQNGQAEIGEALSFLGAEAYNTIRTNVKFSFSDHQSGHIIGITSAMAGDGKSYTSVNLAYSIAKDNARVLLIDGDMRKLTLYRYFDTKAECGLSELLSDQAQPQDCIVKGLLHENLSVLFCGSMPPNPSELLGSESMGQLLESLRDQYDYILVDLPPVGSVIDAAAVAGYLDGMMMVVRHDHTRKKHIRSTIRQLELSGVRMMGFIYNANVDRHPFYGRYYYRYLYHYYKKDYKADSKE